MAPHNRGLLGTEGLEGLSRAAGAIQVDPMVHARAAPRARRSWGEAKLEESRQDPTRFQTLSELFYASINPRMALQEEKLWRGGKV